MCNVQAVMVRPGLFRSVSGLSDLCCLGASETPSLTSCEHQIVIFRTRDVIHSGLDLSPLPSGPLGSSFQLTFSMLAQNRFHLPPPPSRTDTSHTPSLNVPRNGSASRRWIKRADPLSYYCNEPRL